MALLRQNTITMPKQDFHLKKESLSQEENFTLNASLFQESLVKAAMEVGPCVAKIDNTKKRGRHGDCSFLGQRQRRKGGNSWETITSLPDHDGYQWRKYGEKKILNKTFTRCYYKCTYYKEHNCKATKQVQQQDYSEPPIYNVTYFYNHVCPSGSSSISDYSSDAQSIKSQQILDFSAKNPLVSYSDNHTNDIKDEKEEESLVTSTSTVNEKSNSTEEVCESTDWSKCSSDGSAAVCQSQIKISDKEFCTFELPSDQWCDFSEFDPMLPTLEDSEFIESLFESSDVNYSFLQTLPDCFLLD